MNIAHNMLNPNSYPHPVDSIQLVETHISWVLLTGQYAYKLKKPLNLGFLDYSTLEKRHKYCLEEIRLNRRLAPQLYLTAVPITQEAEGLLQISGNGPIVEYAVKMRQFDQESQFDRLLDACKLDPHHIQDLAAMLAQFHKSSAVADPDSTLGSASAIISPVEENFRQIIALIDDSQEKDNIDKIQTWSEQQFKLLTPVINARKTQGFIRECHGDMHLRNIALYKNSVTIFDCIEFNDNLRWIDPISELAFLVMDLYNRNCSDYAHLLLNNYLEKSGDYNGISLLRFYIVYRAMVRAKVACIRAHQKDIDSEEKSSSVKEYRRYISFAVKICHPQIPLLVICHGLSGCGKTTISGQLMQQLHAIRLRSDVERKRLCGLEALQASNSGIDSGLYTAGMTSKTYQRLHELARVLLNANWHVIVDAAFLKLNEREEFHQLAQQLQIPFFILDFPTPINTLKKRIMVRQSKQDDASEATVEVLSKQLQWQEALTETELKYLISYHEEPAAELAQKILLRSSHSTATDPRFRHTRHDEVSV